MLPARLAFRVAARPAAAAVPSPGVRALHRSCGFRRSRRAAALSPSMGAPAPVRLEVCAVWATASRGLASKKSKSAKKKQKAKVQQHNNPAPNAAADLDLGEEEEEDTGEGEELDVAGLLARMETRTQSALDALQRKYGGLQSGRAVPGMLEGVSVVAYEGAGALPLAQLGTISVRGPQQLIVQLYDGSVGNKVVDAIAAADLDLSPHTEGNDKTIVVPVPRMTKENRLQVVKQAKGLAEQTRQSIRRSRAQCNTGLKGIAESITEDELYAAEQTVQARIEARTKEVSTAMSEKEAQIMNVEG